MELIAKSYESESSGDRVDSSEFHRKINTTTYDLSIGSIFRRIEEGVIHLKQLNNRQKSLISRVWDDRKSSRLVESVLLKVPLPACYFSEDKNSDFDVIDGQQRIFSLYRFIKDEFKLKDLEAFSELNGREFHELPDQYQDQIQAHTLRCIVIKNNTDPIIKFNVFERLNTNSTPLSTQEIRSCIYDGEFNDLLSELANEKTWLSIRDGCTPNKRLVDEEIILRFFSFVLQDRKDYYSPMKIWLNDAAIIGSQLDANDLKKCRKMWIDTLNKSLVCFNPTECFRRPDTGKFDLALFDLVTHTAKKSDYDAMYSKRTELKRALQRLFKREGFRNLLDYSVESRSRTFERTEIWNNEMSTMGL